jgi:hypothetical protein
VEGPAFGDLGGAVGKNNIREMGFGILMLTLGVLLYAEAIHPKYETKITDYGFSPVFFPKILLGIWIAISAGIIAKAIFLPARGASGPGGGLRGPAVAFLLTGVYALFILRLGFFFPSVVYSILFMTIFGYRRWPVVIAISLIFPLAMWYTFNFLLSVQLPHSPWFLRI